MITIAHRAIVDVHKKHNFFVSVHTIGRWAKPAKPKYVTPRFLIGSPAGDAGRASCG